MHARKIEREEREPEKAREIERRKGKKTVMKEHVLIFIMWNTDSC